MSVTLEVSKLSGWLKASANCRAQRGHTTEVNAWHGRYHTYGRANQQRTRRACGPQLGSGQKAQAEAHIEHVAYVYDAGGFKAQRLVESNCTLPSPKGASDTEGNACVAEMWHRGKARERTRRACGPARERVLRRHTGAEAHIEHVAYVYDAGGVKAQQLIESIRHLPSPKEASGRGKCVWHTQRRRHTEGRSNQERARRACGPARECGQNAQAEAHAEHGAHVCDAGGVKAQQLIESIRILPSPKRRHPDAEGNVCGTEEKAHREKAESRACAACVRPSSGVWAERAGGSAH